MLHSIQEYLKIINSKITKPDYLSLLVTTVFIAFFSFYLYFQKNHENTEVSYISNASKTATSNQLNQNPFASINGKTYTFSWCSGSDRILSKNRIYFKNEEDAKNSGRTLSKMCGNR